MPIDFPSNPSSGQTYSYAGQQWEYNGVAWDKIITADIANDSNALYGISGSIYASNLATGLLYGGILSINAGNSAHFDITAGKGQIHAAGSTYTADPQPTLNYVTWPSQSGITLTYLATNDTTWIYIDPAGNVQQRTEYYTDDQLEENIIIGQLVHPSRTFINLARTNPNVAYATDRQYEQFIRSFGPIKVAGHTISPNGANLKLNRTSGRAFGLGRNWINDTDNPSVVSDPAQTDCIFYRYYRGATAGTFITVPNQTEIDPTRYDDGTGTLPTVPGGKYTIQRIFYYPNTPTLLGVYYGRAQYTSLSDAAANINFENFTEIENTRTNAIFVGYLLVKSGVTDLTNTSDALILQAGNFRSTTSGGGSVSLMLDDLTDVIISSPENYQVLTYVDGVTGWENLSVTSLPLVSSLRGLTGTVDITNGSGIGLSVSGNTLTVSNTGILSIDGSTGAITNVARTNVANTFNQTQSIEGVGSLGSSYLTEYGGSGITFNFDTGIDTGSQRWASGVQGGSDTIITFPAFTTTLAGLSGTQTFGGTNTFNALTNFNAGISSAGGTFSALTRFTAGISASGGMTLSGTVNLNGQTFTNVVTSVNGSTGAITNVALTNVNNNFSETQTIIGDQKTLAITHFNPSPFSLKYLTIEPYNNRIMYQDPIIGSLTYLTFDSSTVGNFTVNVPNYSTTLAGLAGTQTFTGTNTFNALTNFNAGISSAGGTFSGNIRLQNAEYIQNTTNGRIDFMPAPGGSTHYGMYLDFTSWGFGPRFGTIRSSDAALNQSNILFDTGLVLGSDVRFNFGSNGQNGVVCSTTGNDTIQFFIDTSTGINSGSVAIIDKAGLGNANRSPGSTHINPNLYVYRAGSLRATDFIRLEHDGTYGRIVSGGTSGISIEPGSALLQIIGGISAGGATFNSTVTVDGSNVLNAGNIQTTKAALEIDTARTASRVAIGDINNLGNGTYIYLRNATNELDLVNPSGEIKLGDINSLASGNYIYYYADEQRLTSSSGADNITNFASISANYGFYETVNQIRVTNNARSWFL